MQFLRIDGNFVPSFKPLFQNGRFRPNLTVFTGAYATRVMLEGACAAGIEYAELPSSRFDTPVTVRVQIQRRSSRAYARAQTVLEIGCGCGGATRALPAPSVGAIYCRTYGNHSAAAHDVSA
jgi:hypothetical protein